MNTSHGSPYDRGSADAYYRRPRDPHYWPNGTYEGVRVEASAMTSKQKSEYEQGYAEQVDFKDWGYEHLPA